MRCGNDAILGNPSPEIQRHAAPTFDLSSLPVDVDIDAAELRLY